MASRHGPLRPLRSFLLDQHDPEPRTCTQCGRTGTRGFILDREGEGRYRSDEYVCASETACAKRQRGGRT